MFLYSIICCLILLLSTQVTKSSRFLGTRNAGSRTVSGPTLMCPDSTIVTALFRFSAILDLTKTTGNLLLQKLLAFT